MGKRKAKRRVLIVFIAIISLFGLIYYYFRTEITPQIVKFVESKVSALTTIAVNNAVEKTIGNTEYNELITIEKDAQGKITLLSANTQKINNLSMQTQRVSQNNLNKVGESSVYISFGQFTGFPFLSGLGKKVEIKIMPVAVASCKFASKFDKSGINQTRHQIMLEVETETALVMGVIDKKIKGKTEILICESVIIGEVPETYLTFDRNGVI